MHGLHLVWRIIRWPLGILVVLYIGVVIFSIPHALEKIKTEETVARIHSQKLTIENVNGEHLPPPPDPAQVDATVEGVDANMNGIRDDVEIAIFKKYPNSAKIRAAELQYAMAQQMYLASVFNEETWKTVAEADGRAGACIALTYSRDNLKDFLRVVDSRKKEVADLVFNTPARKDAEGEAYKFTTSFGNAAGQPCDVDLTMLPK